MDYSKNTALIDIVPVANKVVEICKQANDATILLQRFAITCRNTISDMDIEHVSSFMGVWSMLTGTAPLVVSGKITHKQYIQRARSALPLISIQDITKLNLEQLNHIKETVKIKHDTGCDSLSIADYATIRDYVKQLNKCISAQESLVATKQESQTRLYDTPERLLDNIRDFYGLMPVSNPPPMPTVAPPKPDQSIVLVDDFTKVANGLIQLLVKAKVLNKADDEPIDKTPDIQQELAQAITSLINVQQIKIDNAVNQSSNANTNEHRVISIGINNYNESLAAVLSIAHENDVILIPHDQISHMRELRVIHKHAHLYTVNVLSSTNELHTLTKYTINNVFIIGEATQSEYIENVYQLLNQNRNQKIILID